MDKKIIKGKEKGTIVFIHGNSSSSSVFKHIISSEKISQTKVTLDLPGHGNSIDEYRNHKNFSIQFYKKLLADFINSIDDEILLVGNSLGGHLAIEISKEIKNLKGLVIFGTPPVQKPINFEEAFLSVEALQTFLTENPTKSAIENAATIAVFNKKNIQTIVDDFNNSNPLVRKDLATDLVSDNWANQYKIFTQLNVSKFIIVGDVDPSVNPNYLETVKKACNDNCTIIPFKNCGHYPSLEKPNEFLETMVSITSKIF